MTRRALLLVVLFLAAAPLYAGFNEVERAIASTRGVKQVSMPFIGLARFCVWIARPAGVHDFQLATFELDGKLDPHQFAAILRSRAGEGFRPLVQVHSRRQGEWSFVYAKPHGENRIELLVFTHDNEDTVLVRVDVDADVIAKEIGNPRHVQQVAQR